jgi:hypothetical protein
MRAFGLGSGNAPGMGGADAGNTQDQMKRIAQIEQRLKELDNLERDALHLPPAEKAT